MRLALDTNAYSALNAGDDGFADIVRRAEVIGLPIIVIGELRFGFLHGAHLTANTARLRRFLATPRVRVLHIDDATTNLFAEIATLLRRAGTPIQQDDMWIAALCKQHDFTLATRDRDFAHVLGLRTLSGREDQEPGS